MMPEASATAPKPPRHVAIIMDGNGRWATARGLSRTEGHRKGAEAAQRAVESARDLGIECITLFAFSSENWKRPLSEVEDLMGLLRYYLKKETAELHKNGARLRVIGDRERLSADILKLIEHAEDVTRDNTRITVIIALSYGGRQDITQAARKIARRVQAGDIKIDDIDEAMLGNFLQTQGVADPDLVIRTSGENRISNFLLWQMAYSEFYFTDVYWPDFSLEDMKQAVEFYQGRERRFGCTSAQVGQK